MNNDDSTTRYSQVLNQVQEIKQQIEKDSKVLEILTKDIFTRLQKNKEAVMVLEQNLEEYVHTAHEDSCISLFDAFKKTKFLSAKWEQFFPVYEKYISQFQKSHVPIELLELGVQNGGSLEMWRMYFSENAHITGVDIHPDCLNIPFSEGITFLHGDAANPEFVQKNFGEKTFDIIIDDASHIPKDVISSFELLFPKLNMGGVYIIEDTHTSYWKSYGGGLKEAHSHVEYFKNIADIVNFNWVQSPDYALWGDKIDSYKKLNSEISHISFYDSVIVIEKYVKPLTRSFNVIKSQGKICISDYPSAIVCDENFKLEKFLK